MIARLLISLLSLSVVAYCSTCNLNNTVSFVCGGNTTCDWTDPTLWSCQGGSSTFPVNNDVVNLNAPGVYSLYIDGSNANLPNPYNPNFMYFANAITYTNATKNITKSSRNIYFTNVVMSAPTMLVNPETTLNIDLGAANSLATSFTINSSTTMNWKSGIIKSIGTVTTTIKFPNRSFLNILEGDTKTLSQNTEMNGTMSIKSSTLTLSNAKLNMYGTLNISGTCTITTAFNDFLTITGPVMIDSTNANTITFDLFTDVKTNLSIPTHTTVNFPKNASFTGGLFVGADATLNLGTEQFRLANGSNYGYITSMTSSIIMPIGSTFYNYFTFTASAAGGNKISSTDPTASIVNVGTFMASTPVTLLNTKLKNSGIIQLNDVLTTSGFEMSGGSVTGAVMTISDAFKWTAGTVSNPVIVNGRTASAMISGPSVVLDNGATLTVTAATGNTFALSQTTLSVGSGSIVNTANSQFVSTNSTIILNGESVNGFFFTNQGTMTGDIKFSGTGIVVDNLMNIGSPTTASKIKIVVDKGTLNLNSTSNVYLDILDTSTYSTIAITGSTGLINLDGSITLRFSNGFYPTSTTSLALITYPTSASAQGNLTVNWDKTKFNNINGCKTMAFVNDSNKKQYKLTFSGCTSNITDGGGKSSTSKTNIIVSVILVIVIIAVCVGFFAWCKKKYKKKPWDRLRDDRF